MIPSFIGNTTGKAVVADNKIYFAGGWNYLSPDGEPLNSIDIYNAVIETWSSSSLNYISGGVAGVQHNNKIFWGGINWSTMEGKIEILNLQNNGVTNECLSSPRVYPTAVVKNNDIIFFSSGPWLDEGVLSEKFDIYNSITGEKYIGLLNQVPKFSSNNNNQLCHLGHVIVYHPGQHCLLEG